MKRCEGVSKRGSANKKSSNISMQFIKLRNNVRENVEWCVALSVATARKCVMPVYAFFCNVQAKETIKAAHFLDI